MQAITVRYLSVADHKPARLVATTPGGGRLVMSRHAQAFNSLDIEDSAREVAAQLARSLGWAPCTMEGGSTKDAWVFVILSGKAYAVTAD